MRDARERAAAELRVLERDIRDDGDLRRDDVRRIEQAAETDLDDGIFHFLLCKIIERCCRQCLELRRALGSLGHHLVNLLAHSCQACGEVRLADGLSINLHALGVRDEMRRDVEPRADGRLLENRGEHGRNRALAIRARHMNRAIMVLRRAQELEQTLDSCETEPHAENIQSIEISQGFPIVHDFSASIKAS